jgi:hypothetical protein
LKWCLVQAKAKGATVQQHRNRAKATVWKSARVRFAEAVRAQQPPAEETLLGAFFDVRNLRKVGEDRRLVSGKPEADRPSRLWLRTDFDGIDGPQVYLDEPSALPATGTRRPCRAHHAR